MHILGLQAGSNAEVGQSAIAVDCVAIEGKFIHDKRTRPWTDGHNVHDGITGIIDEREDALRGGRRGRNHRSVRRGLRCRTAGVDRRNYRPVRVAAAGDQSRSHQGRARLNQTHARPV